MASRPHYGRAAVFLAVAATLPHLALANRDAPCYDPNGIVALGYYPCDPSAYITNCCASGWTCFSNSLCVVTTASESYPNLTMGAAKRSMCTNPMWNNDICGDFCITGSGNTDGEVVACGDNKFCCLGDYNAGLCDCATNGDSFTVSDGRAQTIIDETATFTGTVSYLISQPTSSPVTSSSTASTATPSGTANSTTTNGSSDPSAPTSTVTETGVAVLNPGAKSKSYVLAIGLSVGLGVVAVALAGGGYLAYRAWQRRPDQGSFGRGSSGRYNNPMDLALEGSEVREQMARNTGGFGRGLPSQRGLDGHDRFRNVPPPPQTRSAVLP